ncbi:related to proline racemase [Fusarium torulosum]|uniref:Related to proline racemase n=1 Tax=Fusarium torulosum TaxID=33205 RepID=A0AAE8MHQ4_9HYPO|nr:related to proline racemase [Fusarium torulosum]
MMHFWKKKDRLRNLLVNEPRDCSAMCHNLVLPPTNPEADYGFIIVEHEEYLPMSGANTASTVTCLLETGMNGKCKLPYLGTIKVDIAYGCMIHALADAALVGLKIKSTEGAKLVEVGECIKRVVMDQTDPVYPENPVIHGVTIVEFTKPLCEHKDGKAANNTVIVSPLFFPLLKAKHGSQVSGRLFDHTDPFPEGFCFGYLDPEE